MLRKFPAVAALLVILSIAAFAVAPTKYSVDANHSTVGFAIPILGGVSTVRGKFTDFSVDVVYDEADVTKSSVTAIIKATSIDTGVEGRDKHLRNADFFDVEKYPEITFQSTRVEKQGDNFVAIGMFTMHGVSKEIALPFTITGKDVNPTTKRTMVGFKANVTIKRSDYGMNWQHRSVANWVGDDVQIDLAILMRSEEQKS
ncbi:MAG TPA: YceI family protein [Pyrinomonadaceae bacterium]|nr:YceI family protein [Pyrinomonadaceae bacterium]